MPKLFRQDHRGSHNWSGERTTPRFIDARHTRATALAKRSLMFESTLHPRRMRRSSAGLGRDRFFADGHGALALAIAQVIQLRATRGASGFDFHLGDARRVQRENAFD